MKIINDNMPEPYCYETDYRKIPKEYLNPRIPHGRGMVKWAPMATIPKQYEMINQHIEEQNKVDKPELDEMALSDLNNVLVEKLFYNPTATIKYWKNGYYKKIECEINKFDSERRVLQVLNENNKKVDISIDCILEIE